MEILFKDDNRIYYINKINFLGWGFIKSFNKNDLTNIPHLDDTEILYHYIDSENGERFPVYYEHNKLFITRDIFGYHISESEELDTKDYTIPNLKLL